MIIMACVWIRWWWYGGGDAGWRMSVDNIQWTSQTQRQVRLMGPIYLFDIDVHAYNKQYRYNVQRTRKWRTMLHMRPADAWCALPGGSTFLSRPPSGKYNLTSKIRLRQSMRIYLKNNPAKFHPDPIWNDGALGFYWRGRPNNRQKKNKMCIKISSWSESKLNVNVNVM